MSAGRLLLIRHGQTGGNKQRYVGWEDVPLDETGLAQAREVAQRLAGERIDGLYSSPLSRAVDTARPLARARGLEIRIREELKEIDYGSYQGLLKTDQPLKLRREHMVAPMPGGESLQDVFNRVSRFGEAAARELAAGASLAVVGHFWSNRMLVGALCGVPFEELFARSKYKPGNGSIYELVCRWDTDREPVSARWIGAGAEEGET
jgi:probable phosphoglycerate mutase